MSIRPQAISIPGVASRAAFLESRAIQPLTIPGSAPLVARPTIITTSAPDSPPIFAAPQIINRTAEPETPFHPAPYADPETNRLGKLLYGGSWNVSEPQLAGIRSYIAAGKPDPDEWRRSSSVASGSMMRSIAAPAAPGTMGMGAGMPLGGIGSAIGRAAGAIARSPTARNIVKVAGGWALWNGVEWLFSDKNPRPRHMNVLNVRALAKADRRLKAFAGRSRKILKKLGYDVHVTHHHRAAAAAAPKKAKKRAPRCRKCGHSHWPFQGCSR